MNWFNIHSVWSGLNYRATFQKFTFGKGKVWVCGAVCECLSVFPTKFKRLVLLKLGLRNVTCLELKRELYLTNTSTELRSLPALFIQIQSKICSWLNLSGHILFFFSIVWKTVPSVATLKAVHGIHWLVFHFGLYECSSLKVHEKRTGVVLYGNLIPGANSAAVPCKQVNALIVLTDGRILWRNVHFLVWLWYCLKRVSLSEAKTQYFTN